MVQIFLVFTIFFVTLSTFASNICPQSLRDRPYNSPTTSGPFTTSVMDFRSAQHYFNEIKKESNTIPFNYVVDGCDMRAFLISKTMKEKWGLDSFKIALESQRGNLTRDTSHTFEGFVEFNRHTATAFCVENPRTKKIEPYMIDPSFFERPVPYSEWISAFTRSSFGDIPYKAYYASMYSLDPSVARREFVRQDIRDAESLRSRFMQEQQRIQQTGIKPYGVGRGRSDIRGDIFSSQ